MNSWVDVMGTLLSFVGFLLLSLGLIRSRQRIEDETATYWGANPFSLRYALADSSKVFVGIWITITGFSAQFSNSLAGSFELTLLENILIAIALSFIGLSILFIVNRWQEDQHQKIREGHFRKVFIRIARSSLTDLRDKETQIRSLNPDQLRARLDSVVQNLNRLTRDIDGESREIISEYIEYLRNKTSDYDGFVQLLETLLDVLE